MTLSANCSLCVTPCYSTEQAVSSAVGDQPQNALAADNESVESVEEVVFVPFVHS